MNLKEKGKNIEGYHPCSKNSLTNMEKILKHQTMGQSKKNRRTIFLVHWKDEPKIDVT